MRRLSTTTQSTHRVHYRYYLYHMRRAVRLAVSPQWRVRMSGAVGHSTKYGKGVFDGTETITYKMCTYVRVYLYLRSDTKPNAAEKSLRYLSLSHSAFTLLDRSAIHVIFTGGLCRRRTHFVGLTETGRSGRYTSHSIIIIVIVFALQNERMKKSKKVRCTKKPYAHFSNSGKSVRQFALISQQNVFNSICICVCSRNLLRGLFIVGHI